MFALNPVLISIGNFEIRWYSIMILLAAISVLFITEREAVRLNVDKNYVFNTLFWAFIFGVIGARLYYVIFNFNAYKSNPIEILQIWNGGLAIHGGLIVGALTLFLFNKKYKVRTLRITDLIVVPLLLGQAIGRWGNFFNMEAHGTITTVAKLKALLVPKFVINGMTINGNVYVPTFYFESIMCLIGFIFLMIYRRNKYIKVGSLTGWYLIIYGTIRFFIEFERTDALMLGAFKVAQIISIIMVIVGIGFLMYLSKKGRFEDLYNDKNNNKEIRY